MLKTLKQITRMRAALWVNAFFYYFGRLWWIGKYMPETVYASERLKRVLSAVAIILRQVIECLGKPLYLLGMVVLPLAAMLGSRPELADQAFAYGAQALFFLSCVVGAFGDSQVFTVTRDKVTCIKYLHMDARAYVRSHLAYKYVPFFTYYLIWLLLAARLLGAAPLQGVLVFLMLFSFRMMGEAVQVMLFDRTGKVLSRNMVFNWVLIAAGLAGAYVPAALGLTPWLGAALLHPAAAAVYTAAGLGSLWYIVWGYRGYEVKFSRSIDLNFLLSSLLKASSGTSGQFKEVEMREKDAALAAGESAKFQELKGYAYMNALFFARHRRQLVRPMYYRLLIAAGLFAAAVSLLLVNREVAIALSRNLTAMLPSFVFTMYFMTVADKASRAMFYNCDKDMLHFASYREPKTILKNFQIRLMRVALYDLAIAGAVCLAAAAFCLLCGTSLFSAELLLFCTAILLLSVLFTVHHLCLYYIFQPYAESLQVKNPFFSAINMAMYILCFLCLQIEAGGVAFTTAVFLFTIAYIAAALALVYRRAPKSFRVK